MSDTASVKVKGERRIRKIPAIVFDRPAWQPARVVFGFVAGAVIGTLLGLLSWLFLRTGPGGAELPGHASSFPPPYVLPFLLIGLAVGFAWAFLEGRTVTPRRSTIEIEVVNTRLRRRSTSTAVARRR